MCLGNHSTSAFFISEGTDWAGLAYQDGGTGGGAGAENSWASVIVATDEPTEIM